MENVVENTLRNLFAKREDLFPPAGTFLCFKNEEQNFTWAEGYQSTAQFGRIVFEEAGSKKTSDPLVLKLSHESVPFKDITVFYFVNEIYFHTSIVPFFQSLRPTNLFANFYDGQLEIDPQGYRAILIFENLQARSYVPTQRRSFLDHKHLSLMLRRLGEFHAYSYRAKSAARDTFRTLGGFLKKTQVEIMKNFADFYPTACERGLRSLAEDGQYRDKVESVRRLCENSVRVIADSTTAEADDELSVLCHGDYLRSNAMFRYENDQPVDVKIVDFANCGIASPVLDLALLLYLNADQPMMDEHWDDLLDQYHTGLRETFPDLEMPSKERILSEFRKNSFIAYIVASFFLGKIIAEDNGMPTEMDLLPEEYRRANYWELPQEENLKVLTNIGGTLATKALRNVLKDLIDRGFI